MLPSFDSTDSLQPIKRFHRRLANWGKWTAGFGLTATLFWGSYSAKSAEVRPPSQKPAPAPTQPLARGNSDYRPLVATVVNSSPNSNVVEWQAAKQQFESEYVGSTFKDLKPTDSAPIGTTQPLTSISATENVPDPTPASFAQTLEGSAPMPACCEPWRFVSLPLALLWEPPLANQREPHLYAKTYSLNGENMIDTAIATQVGLLRYGYAEPNEGIQWDVMAGVFTRFNGRRLLTAADYRVGAPITYAEGNWQAKLAYEHTSTHLGDEYMAAVGRIQVPHVRDEIVAGLAYRFWDQLRVYGQAGYSFVTSRVIGENRDRYDVGLEWSRKVDTGYWGQPFSALDVDIRSDQDYNANLTLQIGWQWRKAQNSRSARMAVEIYDGRSPYGQFFRDKENWVGIVALFDW